LARVYPADTLLNSVYLPTARALVHVRSNEAGKAISELESARPYEFGGAPGGCGYWPTYVRAEAYLAAKDASKAVVEYQRILSHRGVDPASPMYVLSYLGQGRAYALQGDKAKARVSYQNFLAAWKDADPDVPVLIQAKAEYAKLQ